MNAGGHPSVLVAALEAIARRRARQEQDLDEALAEVEREDSQNRRQIEEIHRRLVALRTLRDEQLGRRRLLASASMREEWEAVRRGLAEDSQRLEERDARVQGARAAHEAELEARLQEADAVAAIGEYERHLAVERTLSSLPAPVRKEIQERHERLVRKLQPWVKAVNSPPALEEDEPLGIAVLASADPVDGPPEALVILAPVRDAVRTDWAASKDGLPAWLAWRLVAATFRLLRAVGAADAPVRYRAVHGCLGIQVWLGDHEVPSDLRELALEHLAAAFEQANELAAARVEVYGVWVRPELLTEEPGG